MLPHNLFFAFSSKSKEFIVDLFIYSAIVFNLEFTKIKPLITGNQKYRNLLIK